MDSRLRRGKIRVRLQAQAGRWAVPVWVGQSNRLNIPTAGLISPYPRKVSPANADLGDNMTS
jgi:hypothetical protein